MNPRTCQVLRNRLIKAVIPNLTIGMGGIYHAQNRSAFSFLIVRKIPIMLARTKTLLFALALVLGELLRELFHEAIYSWIVEKLKTLVGFTEAALVAAIIANLLPFVATTVCLLLVYLYGRSHRSIVRPKSTFRTPLEMERSSIPSPSILKRPEHRLRKYYSTAEVASIIGLSEETIFQAAITGDIVLSVVEHFPQNFEEASEEIRDGRPVKVTTRHEVVFSARSDPSPSPDLWYISPDDAKTVIRNPVGKVTLINIIFKDRECIRAKRFLNSYLKITRADLLVSSEELKRFLTAH